MNQKPNFHPISMLPVISSAIRQAFENTLEQLNNLRKIKPGTLDNSTLDRVQNLYQKEKDLHPVFNQQLMIWLDQKISFDQKTEVNELVELNSKLEKSGLEILEICDQYKDLTIEKILDTDDLSLGIDFLKKNF